MATQAGSSIWEFEGDRKREAVKRIFAEIAPNYDRLNSIMSLGRHHAWRAYAVSQLNLGPDATVLDLCCGTGDFMRALRKVVGVAGRVVGLDFCEPLLRIAEKKKCGSVGMGDACRLPIRSNTFDAVTVGWGIRNVSDIDASLREIFRVLKPGGRFASLDMARPRNPLIRAVSIAICHTALPALGRIFGHAEAYAYLPESTDRFMSRERFAEAMSRAGFVDLRSKDLHFGNICMHFGVKPECP